MARLFNHKEATSQRHVEIFQIMSRKVKFMWILQVIRYIQVDIEV